ncbi:hypothetical protein BOVA172_1960 [Bacteroides ovatus]|uniref:Uncharacterized protein n=1 Tax=Bacteroides ovatus (strain ATCC 8483 / DSM 1896 / JCM 5824 / BCRC 10623 / CCUG 4943 / NCTC 11153) TaxID=411476 RepID=A0AAN3A2J3_BACO1|nr:hypothetical protein BACOVA_04987 [Bacteroides ovatus ATCC 8483]CAG9876998.1 hypothetical protein BOVA115_1039 [Bacteroides ovatus]CAG9892662.1 hypothetical protein BOVA713_1136 [Bacteroides ovatus]CAG9908980.1 hypothetical protein BOVA172_1960 [Bacteroides ovatus]
MKVSSESPPAAAWRTFTCIYKKVPAMLFICLPSSIFVYKLNFNAYV